MNTGSTTQIVNILRGVEPLVGYGVGGGTIADHADGATVTHVLTAGALDAIAYTTEKAQDDTLGVISPGYGISWDYSDGSNFATIDVNLDTSNGSLTVNSDGLRLSGDDDAPGANRFYGTDDTSTKAFVAFTGSLTNSGSGIQLKGDNSSPGSSKYWGTDGMSAFGFYDLPSGGGGGATAINDIGDATGAGEIALGSNSITITASGENAIVLTSSMGQPDLSFPAESVTIGASGSGLTNVISEACYLQSDVVSIGKSGGSVTVGVGGGNLGFHGVTPVGLQTLPLCSASDVSGVVDYINSLMAKLNTIGIVGIDI